MLSNATLELQSRDGDSQKTRRGTGFSLGLVWLTLLAVGCQPQSSERIASDAGTPLNDLISTGDAWNNYYLDTGTDPWTFPEGGLDGGSADDAAIGADAGPSSSCIDDSDCVTAPEPSCLADGVTARSYRATGLCVGGTCGYEVDHDETCGGGCNDGVCAPVECAGVTCVRAAECRDGGQLVSFSGSCEAGACVYTERQPVGCEAGCDNGACNTFAIVRRWYSPLHHDHFEGVGDPPDSSYSPEHSYAVLDQAGPGREAIYSCQEPGGADFMFSRDCTVEGYTEIGLVGYAWTEAGSNRVPFLRCRMDHDHFMTTQEDCEGQTHDGQIGFIPSCAATTCLKLPHCLDDGRQVVSYTTHCDGGSCVYEAGQPTDCLAGCERGACNGAVVISRYVSSEHGDHWEGDGDPPDQTYAFEHGYLILADPADDRAPIYSCKNPHGTDYMFSKDCELEGYDRISLVGYVWNAEGPNRQQYLRCRTNGDHFMTTQADCEGQTHDGVAGYIPAP